MHHRYSPLFSPLIVLCCITTRPQTPPQSSRPVLSLSTAPSLSPSSAGRCLVFSLQPLARPPTSPSRLHRAPSPPVPSVSTKESTLRSAVVIKKSILHIYLFTVHWLSVFMCPFFTSAVMHSQLSILASFAYSSFFFFQITHCESHRLDLLPVQLHGACR